MDPWMALIDTIIRSLFAVCALGVLARVNGAKQISQLSFYDYVTGITIGSMATVMAIDDMIPFWLPLTAMIIFVFASYLEGRMTLRSLKIRKILDGVPTVLIANGKIIQEHMRKAHLTVNELTSEARVSGYFNLHDIAYAIMENSGKISFLPFSLLTPYTKKDANLSCGDASLFVNVVIDGFLLERELQALGKNKQWFQQRCEELHYGEIEDILLAIADRQNHLYIWYKNETTKHKEHFI